MFKDETKLDINYIPYALPHRESELRLLKEFFSFALQFPEKMTQRVIITGDVGTGKTALCQRFGADIAHEAAKKSIRLYYVHVNCREYRGSLFFILQHAVSIFHPNFPKRGYSAEELLGMLMQMLDEEKAHIILTLDEFESLVDNEGNEAVYRITRLHETRPNKPQRLSLIFILRELKVIERLDASTRSSLQSNVISLQKYSKKQLFDILATRAILAFKQSAVPDDTLEMIAENAFSEGGNARFGIELLWRAGKYANTDEQDTVTAECVRKAVSSIVPAMRRSDLENLNLHEKLFLLGLSRIFKQNQNSSVTLAQAEQAYAIVCEEFNTSPVSHTQLWKYLRALSGIGILKAEVMATGTRGRSTNVSLPRIPASELEKELYKLLAKKGT